MFEISEAKKLKPITVVGHDGKKAKLELFQDEKSGYLVAVDAAFLEKNGWFANPFQDYEVIQAPDFESAHADALHQCHACGERWTSKQLRSLDAAEDLWA